MEHNENTFEYTYSAPQQAEIKRIREKYIPKEETKMDQLRRLDNRATQKASVASLVLGTISALILGFGMCCTMVWADRWFFQGVIIGIVGLIGIALAYPLYARIAKKEREKVAPEIMRLTDELMK